MSSALPAPAFRIAVTGVRALAPAEVARIEAGARQVLHDAATALQFHAAGRVPWLRLISPLGEGADRLFARAAPQDGPVRTSLEVPLPFAQPEYEATFAPEGVAEFRALLARAGDAVVTLDGAAAPDEVRQRSYEALGQYLVRHCDLLVAVWDDERTPNGRGGTADTVRFALRSGVPVWWIHARRNVPPRWLRSLSDLEEDVAVATPIDALNEHIARLLSPPSPASHDHGQHRVIRALQRWFRVDDDPVATYLAEPDRTDPPFARIHQALIGALRRAGGRSMERHHDAPPVPPPRVSSGIPDGARSLDVAARAAGLSRKYQHRYRSSYLAILLLGAVALVAAVLSLVYTHAATPLLLLEITALLGIALLWLCNEVFGWHRRYLAYRALAELNRCYVHLAPLGRGSPLAATAGAADHRPEDWHVWLFAAAVRAAPALSGALDPARIAVLKDWIRADLIDRQCAFHRLRWAECRGAERLLGWIGVWLFVGTIAVVSLKGGLKSLGLLKDLQEVLGVLAAFLPGLSAATFGIRSYEELGSLADQSEQMIATLRDIAPRFDRIPPDAPLAAQQIGAETAAVATAMLSDTAGWSQLFRSKTIEA